MISFNGTCNSTRKGTFNWNFLRDWHAKKSRTALNLTVRIGSLQIRRGDHRFTTSWLRSLIDLAGCTCTAKYPCVGIDPWNATVQRAVLIRTDVFRCLRFFAQLSVFCVRLSSRCIDVSIPAIYMYRHREIRLTRLRSLTFQLSPPFSPVVHHVDRPCRRGGGENSRRSSVTIRIF